MLSRILRYGDRLAIIDSHGAYTYNQLNEWSQVIGNHLKELIIQYRSSSSPSIPQNRPSSAKGDKLHRQPRIAYMCPRDHTYVTAKLGAWQAGAIGVPIAENYPTAEIEYVLQDSGASAAVVHPRYASSLIPAAEKLGLPILSVDTNLQSLPPLPQTLLSSSSSSLLDSYNDEGAMLIYTSGTTGRPKGVLHKHSNLEAQVSALSQAWGWTNNDHILNVLPLHHVHGVVAILLSALYNGAICELSPKFDAPSTWSALTRTNNRSNSLSSSTKPLTLFMAVPTVYARLVETYDKASSENQALWSSILQDNKQNSIRLMVSGSAALPEPLARRWKEITGHGLLERYGMTEFSMAISNPLHGNRKLNSVGKPLPGYEARIFPEGDETLPTSNSTTTDLSTYPGPGELQIRGPGVFSEYWGKPEATAETFTKDGWFKTGDCATRDDDGYYFILGRMSADIIKSGGYKISALDIERILLDHEDIAELAVLGVPDAVYGERIAAVVVLKPSVQPASLPEYEEELNKKIKVWAKDKLAPYKIPSVYKILTEMPRNAMGKVNKKELRKQLFG